MNILVIKALVMVGVTVALLWIGHHFGARGVQSDWAKETAERKVADNLAIMQRIKNNERAIEQHAIDNQRITKERNEAIAKVRADIARSPGLRVGPGVCSGFAAGAKAKSAGGGDGTDTGTRLLPEEVDRVVKSLIEETERVAATGRACQEFVRSNGMAP